MSTFQDTYVGFAPEVTYGTLVQATIFNEFLSEGVLGKYERIESEGLRAGKQVQRTDRWVINPKGAEGSVKFELSDQGFEKILGWALGSLTSPAAVTGFISHALKLATLSGQAFSTKVGRVDSSGTMNVFDYTGGKVKSWEIANSTDGIATLNVDLDFVSETTGGTAATPTYLTSSQVFSFVNGSVTVGGTAYPVMDISIKGDNALNTERYSLRGANSTAKREPLTEGLRSVTFEMKGEFQDLTQFNRFKAATTAAATAPIIAQWDTPQGGQLLITLANCRFDGASVAVDGTKILEHSLTGVALTDGTAEPIAIVYKAKV